MITRLKSSALCEFLRRLIPEFDCNRREETEVFAEAR